jgi:hypothetical protein
MDVRLGRYQRFDENDRGAGARMVGKFALKDWEKAFIATTSNNEVGLLVLICTMKMDYINNESKVDDEL